MDGDKKKRLTNRKLSRLSLSQSVESNEESLRDFDSPSKSNGNKVSTKSPGGNAPQETFKSPTRIDLHESTSKTDEKATSKMQIKDFCPICQVPLPYIKIPVELHTAHCLIDPDILPACPDGIACVSVNMFHYRDFNHNELASWRCSAEYYPMDYLFPAPKSAKKRPSLSPLSLASRTKKIKTPDNEKTDDPGVGTGHDLVRKALFTEELNIPTETHKPNDSIVKDEVLDKSFRADAVEKVPVPANEEVKPVRCDVIFEYNAEDTTSSKTVVASKQSACSVACLSSSTGTNEEELQAVCTVNIKMPGGKPQVAASISPVHVNLLLNESGWEAVQVDGSSTAQVKEVDISLCKCAHAMSLKCLVADANISNPVSNQVVQVEHKYSVDLNDLGLKRTTQTPTKESQAGKVDRLKSKNAQLSIKTFFKSDKDREEKPTESTKVPAQANGDLPKKSTSSLKSSRPKTPMILLAGSSASRPLTPIALGGEPSFKSSTSGYTKPRRIWGNSTAPVPQYKRIPDTPFVVDAFQWGSIEGVRAYFLSHFHSDHYKGLKKNFSQPIYCSKITANLIRLKFGVDPKFLHILEIGNPRVICNVEVDVFDANHCPGSLMFLFRLLDGRSILHVGDFRASSSMEEIRCLRQVDILYLDTTYCEPTYDFPSQEEIINEVVRTAKFHVQQNPKTLFCCGSYTIGKEKVFVGIAEALDCKVFTNKEKARVLKCLDYDVIEKRLVADPKQAQIHVVYMRDLNFQNLENILKDAGPSYTSLVAFEPTGWTTSKIGSPSTFKKSSRGRVTIYAVPYSEHSSYSELRRFVRFVRPKKIQATVNLGKQKHYKNVFKQWLESSGGEQASLETFLRK